MRVIETGDLTPQTHLTRNERDWVYNGLDCCVTLEIYEELIQQLTPVTRKTYDFSLALQAPILDMTQRGILIDQRRRVEVLDEFRRQTAILEYQLNRILKEGLKLDDFNWRSPKQLLDLFYNVLGLPPIRKKNAQGKMAPTTNREALERLQHHFFAEPICLHILALRDLGKKIGFLSTEVDPDGRIRSSYNIAGTNTGRLSSSMSDFGTGTNLQNVDKLLRSVFIADPGMKFADVDGEQADARNVGAICWNLFYESHGEDFAGAYLDACESGDLHTAVTRMAWTDLEWTEPYRKVADALAYRDMSYRDLAKRLGHGTNYMGQPATMSKHTKVPEKQISEFQKNYFAGFPCIQEWHKEVERQLAETRTITSLLGRRRVFFGNPKDPEVIRAAVAYDPQSSTGDEVNRGMLQLWRSGLVQLSNQVHDSLLFQYPEEQEDEILPKALELMRVRLRLKGDREFGVPIGAKVGWNWGGADDENVDGLTTWRGTDKRVRQNKPKPGLDIKNFL